MNEKNIKQAMQNPQNRGEMAAADAVGTAGSPGCGDMLKVWLKFREDQKGKKTIDRATFQSFGCETAIAVASVAMELLRGKTVEEAKNLSDKELSAPLGPLPPMKIHCASLVEEALRDALKSSAESASDSHGTKVASSDNLRDRMKAGTKSKGKVVLLKPAPELS
ncbi:MAG: iron-sulfur cluster assembly scaffold protein [Verrucomicrobiae bacterium]|nr:iron-sulfur cluster assembly scaffold protein [Verrucomicrobiae bacterium]